MFNSFFTHKHSDWSEKHQELRKIEEREIKMLFYTAPRFNNAFSSDGGGVGGGGGRIYECMERRNKEHCVMLRELKRYCGGT